ncbi:MAG: FAD:protein FMN transferase [Planctomycetaceae bacterium]|nr:FAD:protein FMN transferase [Planctomycetaceae bacterium]
MRAGFNLEHCCSLQRLARTLAVICEGNGRHLVLWAVFLLIHSCCLAAASVSADQPLTSKIEGSCFGPIRFQVTVGQVLTADEQRSLASAVQIRLDEINRKMSTYTPDSDITRFNRESSTEWFPVDLETARVVELAQRISEKSEGAFDVTVGPLVAAWKFGAANPDGEEDHQIPSAAEIKQLLDRVGYAKLEVRLDPPALRKQVANLELDLSAVAKGYAVDEVANVVAGLGYESYFVEVGEEVRAAGRHPAGRTWVCGIEKPLELEREIELKVPLENLAIATSGDYRQFRMVEDRRYSHTIDPRTGYPTDGQVALASIATSECSVADAWATAAMVLGVEKMLELSEQHRLGLHMVTRDAQGQLTSRQNARYPKPIVEPQVAGPNWVVMVGATVLVFGLALAGMSVGVMFKRKPISGSCGGLANMPNQDNRSPCELCSNPSQECRELGRGAKAAREAREAAEAAEHRH